jgi:DNA sulfur modification protein DndD
MKINNIILSNIGAYYGHYELNLSVVHPKKNLILFGGKNGAGKTTLLESIRLALFGTYAFGFRTESEQYLKKIKSLLNKNAVSQGDSNFRIIIEIDKVENYERKTYLINRSWHLINSKPKEVLEVKRDGQYLSEREKEIFQTKLREETPPQLFELCLFDGEEIGRIITENRLPEYLKNSAKVLFNLDLFENLENDLAQYRKQTKANGKHEELQQQLDELEIMQAELQKILDLKRTNCEEIILRKNQREELLVQLKNEFEVHGGLVKEQRDTLIQKISKIEHERKENAEKVKSFITGLLPVFLVKDLLGNVKNQMMAEQENESFAFIKEKLSADKLTSLVSSLSEKEITLDDQDSFKNLLVEGVLQAIQPSNSDMIHRASFTQRSEIENTVNQLEKLDENKYTNIFKENQTLLSESQNLRKQVEENDKNHNFKELLDQISECNKEIEKLNINVLASEEEIKETEVKFTKNEQDLERLKAKIIESSKSETTLSLALKISEVSKRFRFLQLGKKLQQVEMEATYMANLLYRKEDFLEQIKINPETFELTLYSHEKEEIDQFSISAGERELLLLSIFWAMYKTSGHRLPFIFDTLLGRLDKTHKERLLTQFIPRCGEQVIVLSTDSEIDHEHLEYVKPILSKAFTLEYDKEQRKTNLYEGQYFNLFEMELSK